MKKLFYTIDYRNIECGYRSLSVYTIEDNQPKLWFELDGLQDDEGFNMYSDEEEIQLWLDNNEFSDEYEMEQL